MSASGGIGGAPLAGPTVCTPDGDDCTVSHASTGWCLAATGQPVIVITRIPCEGIDADPTITMILASTGAVVPTQAVVPCAGNDWEIETLCDFDEFGEVIAVVTQIFQWNEATQELTVRLVRADDPDGPPYVVQGTLRQCAVPTWVDVELAMVCGDTAGVRRQLTEMIVWDTRNGSLLAAFYLDAEGNVTPLNPGETVTVGDCWTPTLPAILDELENVNGSLDDANAELDTQTGLLTSIRDNADQVEPKLDTLIAQTDQIEPKLDTIIAQTDQVEPLLTAGNALLTTIRDNADQVEPKLDTLIAQTDQVEPLLTAGNASTATIAGAVKNEDAAVANGDPGIPALARRNDTGVNTTTTDGDYSHIAVDAAGRVGVTPLGGTAPFPVSGNVEIANDVGNPIPVSGTVTITDGAGPVTVDGTVTAAEAKAEDAPATNGDPGIPILGVRNDAAANRTSNDGDYGNLALDAAGRLLVTTVGNTLGVTDAALATTNAQLTLIAGYTDGIEGLLTAIQGRLSLSALLAPGQVAVGVAAVQMHPAGQALQQGVVVTAHPNNPFGSIVYVGIAGVTTGTGFPLAPGASLTLPVPNTNQVYLIGSQAALTAAWIGV